MIPSDEDSTAAVVVRHEEILHIVTETIALETVRIEKYIITERRTFTADVRREEIRITRTPITDPDELRPRVDIHPAPPITMVLHEEQLAITTTTVPVETVTIRVASVPGEHRIDDTLRREEVDIAEHATTGGHEPDPAVT
tara:strand:- start:2115 stop:2537 length:423 start_codon:yes stop_codon:yes gene_type:complete